MVRNRLAELQEKSGVKAPDSAEEELKPLNKQDKKMSTSQEDFLNNLHAITSDIDNVHKNVKKIQTLQTRILQSVTADPKEKDELNDLNDATKKLANKIRQTLKIQQGKNEKSQEQDTTKLSARQQTDLRLRLTQVASQSKRFQEVWSEYNDSQLNFRKKTKANLVKQIKVTGQTDLSNDEIEQMIDDGKTDGLFGANTLDQTQQAKATFLALTERHGDIMKLEKQIEEVAELFKEIANLVDSQGEMVDNIYQNVLNSEINVEKGRENLAEAEKHQRSARKKKLICAILLIIVILIVLLVILSEFGAFSSSDTPDSTPTKVIIIYNNGTKTETTDSKIIETVADSKILEATDTKTNANDTKVIEAPDIPILVVPPSSG